MSEASLDNKLGPLRGLRDEELAMIKRMISGTSLREKIEPRIYEMRVQDMPDGGMGSIKFYSGRPRSELEYGKQIAEAAFKDADGVPVSVTLSVDQAGDLFELDIFKADGSPLVRYPDMRDFKIIKRKGKLGYASAQS